MTLGNYAFKHKLVDGRLVVVRGLHLKDVCRAVAEHYGVPADALTRLGRAHARARQVAAALSYWLTANSSPQVAAFYGYRDHTAVTYAAKNAALRLQSDSGFRADIAVLRDRLRNRSAAGLGQVNLSARDEAGASSRGPSVDHRRAA